MKPLVAVVLVLVLSLSGSGLAQAEDPLARPTDATARKHLERGEAFYKVEKWDEAVVEFEKGALVAPDLPVWYFALGQAHRQAGRYERARWYYERFLSSLDENDPDAADVVATVRELIDDMNTAQHRPPTEAAPSSVPPATSHRPEGAPVPGRPSTFTTQRRIGVAVAGVAVVGLGAGVVFGIRASDFKDQARVLCPTTACENADEANALEARASANARSANIAYGVSAAAALAAVVLWLTGSSGPATVPEKTVVISPRLSSTVAGIEAMLRF